MSKNLQALIAFLILVAAIFWSLDAGRPQADLNADVPANQFSVLRAFQHVEALAQEPHYVGSPAHSKARNYIVSQLEDLGLLVQTQEGYSLNKYGVVTRPKNIISRIEGTGNGKALLLLTHYDSAMHSSFGASDAASGVATILEGVRAFLASGELPENDLILVFTDAEELGLNGADLFVQEHPWAEDVGLALNFESRGSGGSSFMLLETNNGNKGLLEHFFAAGVEYPVTSSLYYSVYKMLPNDTDLTVLREQGDITGLNFAFIDDHFDYHTATDLPENLDLRTLAHQGSYLMPLLSYSANVPLENFESEEDLVFFNIPVFNMINYPFSWIWPMLIIAVLILFGLVFYGISKNLLLPRNIVFGFAPLLIVLVLSGLAAFGLWEFALFIYPQYNEMEHGFTYNGYWYIAAVIFLVLAVCFYTYNKFRKPKNGHQLFVAPLVFWLLINLLAALYLKGAAYFIVPVYFGLVQLAILFWRPKFAVIAHAFLSIPAIFIFMLFIVTLPVALGLKMLFLSAVLTALVWSLLWPVFCYFKKNQWLGFLSFICFFIFFVIAHFKADFNSERPKPNSLVYVYDKDLEMATWNTYDEQLDAYTSPYFNDSSEVVVQQPTFSSKYNSGFKRSTVAPKIMLPEPYIGIEKVPGTSSEANAYEVKIAPNRKINRIDLFADKSIDFRSFTVNGKEAGNLQPGESDLHVFKNRWSDKLLTYYAANRDTLRINVEVEAGTNPDIALFESAFSLPDEQQLKVSPRTEEMIPRPFVLNDAIVIKRTFKLE